MQIGQENEKMRKNFEVSFAIIVQTNKPMHANQTIKSIALIITPVTY